MKRPRQGNSLRPGPSARLSAPKAEGIEARDHDLAIGLQHARGLAQYPVRMSAEFEHVRQDHQVDAAGGERQGAAVGAKVPGRIGADAGAQGNAVAAQQITLRQVRPERVEAEHVLHGAVELRLLPAQHVLARGRGEPVGQS